MWPESNRAHFIDVRCRDVLPVRDIKICLGFLTGALKTATKIYKIFSEIPANLQTVMKH